MRIARLTGSSPHDVLEMDDALFAAATDEARLVAGWLPSQEILSLIFERLDALFIAFVQANSKRAPSGLKPTRLPRPGEAKQKATRLSWSEFAQAAEGGVMVWR